MKKRSLFILLMLAGATLFPASCTKETMPPHFLLGVWETDDPRFQDRYLKITREKLIFGLGEGRTAEHLIDQIKRKKVEEGFFFTIYYKDIWGKKWTQSMTYDPAGGGTIQLKNRSEIWKKAE
jgi:hypothetical protein